jgi:hypothetical protein
MVSVTGSAFADAMPGTSHRVTAHKHALDFMRELYQPAADRTHAPPTDDQWVAGMKAVCRSTRTRYAKPG